MRRSPFLVIDKVVTRKVFSRKGIPDMFFRLPYVSIVHVIDEFVINVDKL